MTSNQNLVIGTTIDKLLADKRYSYCRHYPVYLTLWVYNRLNKMNPRELSNDMIKGYIKATFDVMEKSNKVLERNYNVFNDIGVKRYVDKLFETEKYRKYVGYKPYLMLKIQEYVREDSGMLTKKKVTQMLEESLSTFDFLENPLDRQE